ncbi:MAG: pyridoxal phosphate-dependent aminotransferase [Candidatus Heimdallarchaeota archaeon]|nr:pyridoxal phosphate-dependent aminotransferase [Candidatus Heimdallarchaeota archaeon]
MSFVSEKMKIVKPSGIRELFSKAQGVKNVISLGIGTPDIKTPIELKEALRQAVSNDHNSYSQTSGEEGLREAITTKYKQDYGVDYSSSDGVIVTCGGCELIYIALQTYINQGDEVLLQNPSFLTYLRQISLTGGKPIWMPSDENLEIDIEKMKNLITDKSKAIILNFPSNPTGTVMKKEKLQAIVDLAVDHNLLIISDEVYEYIVFDDHKHVHVGSLNGAYERTITVNSFSKTFCIPGWRMGYGLSSPELLKHILVYHSFVVANATTPTQVALAQYMNTPESKDFVEKTRMEFQRRRNILVEGFNSLAGINCLKPEGSLYCYPNISETKYPNDIDFSQKIFEETQVVLVPGTEFGPSGTTNVRASFGSADENTLKEVVDRLSKVL